MSENPIAISNINDFIFCPASIYYHLLGNDLDTLLYHDKAQIDGSAVHSNIDQHIYSTSKHILQGITVYCERYNLIGKIDIFDENKHILIERKNKITRIYDGYIFQIYAQYFALTDMGYVVNELYLYSYQNNKNYSIALPKNDPIMWQKFDEVISNMRDFELDKFHQKNPAKCRQCVYRNLCDRSLDN